MSRPGRPKDHVHNWRITVVNPGPWEIDGNGFYGLHMDRYWECVRGDVVKHTSPSGDYPFPVGLYGQRARDFHPMAGQRRVFIAASGYYPKELANE